MPRRVPTYRPARPPGLDRHRQYNRHGRDPALLLLYSRSPWRRFREFIRARRVLCERCKAEGRLVEGVHVHHVLDPREEPDLAYDEGNVELLCASCHARHHATEKGRPPEMNRPILGVDFCGTITTHASGWKGAGVITDPPVDGAIDFLTRASELFQVAIVSGRFRKPEQRIGAQRAMIEWLVAHGIPREWITVDPFWTGRIVLANFRPSCMVTLDDRALTFAGTYPEPEALLGFEPWYKRHATEKGKR